jgi:hypothetical protein
MYQTIVQMQQHDRQQPGQFQQDLHSMNDKLHAKGLMPNVEIMGVDERNHALITRDVPSHKVFEQNASAVNDFRMLGSTGDPREVRDAMRAAAAGIHGIERNPDGSYEVPMGPQHGRPNEAPNPFMSPNAAAFGFMNQILRSMTGSGEPGNYFGGIPGGGFYNQAWRGWDEKGNAR